ncbi:collagen alpha-1(XII) chain-like [Thunnus maccoyii]|uniref:collagen alpha-1(XII) chain-like n=1 Tax=Thunnus maccoyii TaxID=8240 RepID=UPI001C4AEEDF|nr:collagen alpha-1(XII) chain-like [Thunnus maccoyii]
MRSDSQKILILITDGESRDIVSLDSHHLRDDGIEIYTIGVKNVNEAQLRTIASDPDEIHMFSVIDSSFLLDIVANLTINLCNRVNSYSSEIDEQRQGAL